MTYEATILVAIYKASHYLRAKLEDLQQQTYFDKCKIVLLNCENLENESSIYKEFAKQINIRTILYYQYVRLYRTWNDGINATDSKYILNSNVDDLLHPTYIEQCCQYLDTHPEVGIVSSQVHLTDVPNQVWPKWNRIIGHVPIGYPGSTAGPCPVWRRSLHDKYGYFDNYRVIGDARMWEKWLAGGEQFAVIDKPLVMYYISPTSLERRSDNGVKFIDLDLAGQ